MGAPTDESFPARPPCLWWSLSEAFEHAMATGRVHTDDRELLLAYARTCTERGAVLHPANALLSQAPDTRAALAIALERYLASLECLEDEWPAVLRYLRAALFAGWRIPRIRGMLDDYASRDWTQHGGCCDADGGQEPDTTFMVKNLPVACTQSQLIKIWPPQGSYDYLYVPYNTLRQCGCGYCFINFTSPEAARCFLSRWSGRYLPHLRRVKPLSLIPAETQGFHNQIVRLHSRGLFSVTPERSKVGELVLPAVFRGASKLDFWEVASAMRQNSESFPRGAGEAQVPVCSGHLQADADFSGTRPAQQPAHPRVVVAGHFLV